MTNDQMAALEALARVATPGSWRTSEADDTAIMSYDNDVAHTVGEYSLEFERMEADAAYIAAAILSLITRAREAEADARRFRWLARQTRDGWEYVQWKSTGNIRAAIDDAMNGDKP